MFQQITHQQAEKMIEEAEVAIVDVRSRDSYENGHIPNAINLQMANLHSFCTNTPHDMPVLVYCYHGISSQAVAQHLIEQGFNQVYSLIGGFETWHTNHHPTSDTAE